MSFLSECATSHFKKNPSKIFFYGLNNALSGKNCINEISKISDFLRKNNISSIAIKSANNLSWPLIYLAADSICKRIYLFNDSVSSIKIKKILKRDNINCFYENESNKTEVDFGFFKIYENSINSNKKSPRSTQREDMLFTSGTTGNPKGVIINQDSYCHVAKQLIKKLNQKSSDLELLSMPFSHSFGLVRLRSAFICGSSTLITNGLKDFPEIYSFSSGKITGLSLVPSAISIIKILMKNKVEKFSKNINYFEIGSSFLDKDLDSWVRSNFYNAKVYHHYGMTEASRSFLRSRTKKENIDFPNNWIGEPLDGCEYKVDYFSESKNVGELLIKGKNLFSGYLNSNKYLNKSGWYRTKDICEHKDNKIFLLGRLDNQINVGGEKIQAEEIEKLVLDLDDVEDVTAFAIQDKIFGFRVACLIKIKNLLDRDKIESFVNKIFSGHPSFMKPKLFFTLEKIPKTENGKKIRNEKILLNLINEFSKSTI